jgi:two-component system OmpR family response regulator
MQNLRISPRKTVLIVEDEPDTAEMLGEMMRLSGYQSLHACNGKAALELIHLKQPAAIILDVLLPDLTGLEVLRAIRRNAKLEALPVILVSGNSHPRDIQSGLEAGASLYMTKPLDFWELKEALANLMKANSLGIQFLPD